ncbi:MAG TPA: hypothetical protein VMY99_03420 [Nevskiaceae bacterium]|nr:hypothetical protein [Nevskiaceae bacterium]
MKLKKLSQDGFHVIELAVVLLVIGAVGFVGYKVFSNKDADTSTQNTGQTSTAKKDTGNTPVKWAFNEKELKWFVQSGTAPQCKNPFTFDQTPIDLSKVMAIGMPGAYRGYSYKPHGGFRLVDSTAGKIDVKMPIDATLTGISRYYEGSPAELQYLLSFETDCGIAFRFDHLYSLTPQFQALAETTAEPKLNDTRTDPNRPFTRTKFKAGDVVATEVGFPRVKNYGFDFGAYDYRSPNDISKNKQWAAIHNQYQSLDWFGRCWTNMLPGADAAKAKELSLVVINPQKPNIISDTCTYAPYNTLDFNSGKPTDG